MSARSIAAATLAALWLAAAASAAADGSMADASVIAGLDCDRLSRADIDNVLVHTKAPRIIAVSGTFGLSTMDPFARFLVAMGYPADRIKNPATDDWSYSSAMASSTLAGLLAWHYERDGMSNFVADPLNVLGWDPHDRLIDYIEQQLVAKEAA